MTDVIFDCDITMGLPGRDVDDGLALLHLLGSDRVRLVAITSTFGNATIEEVHPCLLSVLKELGRSDIPAYRGAPSPADHGGAGPIGGAAAGGSGAGAAEAARNPRHSEAAAFLAEAVRSDQGGVTILATGSTTNLLGALRIDPCFFNNAGEIIFMGGISEPLLLAGQEMKELNFSSDPEAALYSLYAGVPPGGALGASFGGATEAAEARGSGAAGSQRAGPAGRSSVPVRARCPITVISGNLCLQALLTRERFKAFADSLPSGGYFRSFLEAKILPWLSWIEREYGLPGFHAWDAAAALYLTHPDLFDRNEVLLRSNLADLESGVLRTEPRLERTAAGAAEGRLINLPGRILDTAPYWRELFAAWRRAGEAL